MKHHYLPLSLLPCMWSGKWLNKIYVYELSDYSKVNLIYIYVNIDKLMMHTCITERSFAHFSKQTTNSRLLAYESEVGEDPHDALFSEVLNGPALLLTSSSRLLTPLGTEWGIRCPFDVPAGLVGFGQSGATYRRQYE